VSRPSQRAGQEVVHDMRDLGERDESRRFDAWLRRVDQEVGNLTGLSYLDLPDVSYWDMFDEGRTPRYAARKAVREAGGDL
jgi:hypothetical protein